MSERKSYPSEIQEIQTATRIFRKFFVILREKSREGDAGVLLQPSMWNACVIMNWIILMIAGLCECAFAFCLGKSKMVTGNSHYLWLGGFVIFTVLSMILLTVAIRRLPIAIAYPVWTGIGAVGTVLLSILVLREPATPAQIFFLCLLITSIIGLKLVSH